MFSFFFAQVSQSVGRSMRYAHLSLVTPIHVSQYWWNLLRLSFNIQHWSMIDSVSSSLSDFSEQIFCTSAVSKLLWLSNEFYAHKLIFSALSKLPFPFLAPPCQKIFSLYAHGWTTHSGRNSETFSFSSSRRKSPAQVTGRFCPWLFAHMAHMNPPISYSRSIIYGLSVFVFYTFMRPFPAFLYKYPSPSLLSISLLSLISLVHTFSSTT